jgi:hypothetical protein
MDQGWRSPLARVRRVIPLHQSVCHVRREDYGLVHISPSFLMTCTYASDPVGERRMRTFLERSL